MVFSLLQEGELFGRTDVLRDLLDRVKRASAGRAKSIALSGDPGSGKTEVLRQVYSHLFWKQHAVVPFLYAVTPALLSADAFARHYLSQYLCQHLAFVHRDQSLLVPEAVPLDRLWNVIEERRADWARPVLERFIRSTADAGEALRVALETPRAAAVATALPVAVLVDDFHLLKGLRTPAGTDPQLASVFGAAAGFGRTPHILAGNAAALQEMPVAASLERISLTPLGTDDSASLAFSLLKRLEAEGEDPPEQLLFHLGGNPFYLESVLGRASAKQGLTASDYWKAYVDEVGDGILARKWTALVKESFPELRIRALALAAAHRILHAESPLSTDRIAQALSLPVDQSGQLLQGLYATGLIRGEFGVFRPTEDRVVRDIIEWLYGREIQGTSAEELERRIREEHNDSPGQDVRFEFTLPLISEAELVAAQSLEQIAKNMAVSSDAVGQMQIAVIEACINAIEHSRGPERTMHLAVVVGSDRLEVSIESPGQAFIVAETGEPFEDNRKLSADHGRGWGVKLMKRFVDEVRFESTARGTKTILVKHFVAKTGVQKEKDKDRE